MCNDLVYMVSLIFLNIYNVYLRNLLEWLFGISSGELMLIIATFALALATFGLCYYTRSLVKSTKDEHWFNIYFEYNKRFSAIMTYLLNQNCVSKENKELIVDDRILQIMTLYFNLCLEEFTLERKRILSDQSLWDQWRQGIINYMGKKEFQDAWATIKNNKCYPEDFRIYMDNLREDAKK